MKESDLENELRNLRYRHLTQAEMVTYCDEGLSDFDRARAEAHLKLCLICDRRLSYLREEREAQADRQLTDEDREMVRRAMQKMGLGQQVPASGSQAAGPAYRLAEYLRQIVECWQAHFRPLIGLRGADDQTREVWKAESKDGVLKARATIDRSGDLTIHFSSSDLSLEGVRLNITIGMLNRKITLHRVSDSEVYTKMEVPRQQRPKNLGDISIEII